MPRYVMYVALTTPRASLSSRTSKGDRPRPHKPAMLLSVLSLAESGRLTDGRIQYSPDLLEIFARYFEIVRAGSEKASEVIRLQ